MLFVGFSIFYAQLAAAPKKKAAFLYGWLFGFGYFVSSLWWIANALLVPGNDFLWVWPLAVAGLPAGLAFFPALACVCINRCSDMRALPGFLFFVSLMALAEWLRGHIFTGFPWNLYAYGWSGWDGMIQNLAWGGPYMLTLLTVFWAALPGFLYRSEATTKHRAVIASSAIVIFAVCFLYGHFRLITPDVQNNDTALQIKIVQPNILQEDKWNPEKAGENLHKLLSLSAATDTADADEEDITTLIVWPETAITLDTLNHPVAHKMMAEMMAGHRQPVYLATGLMRFEETQDKTTYFNSLALLDQDLNIASVYDKTHLVPFGEYIPFQKNLSFTPLAHFEGFATGPGPRTLQASGLPGFSPLICYEVIFPGAVISQTDPGPSFILNVTNDGWYGDSPGPRQHFMQARFRAIEEGLPVVRAANTGISGLIDSYGRPLLTIALGSQASENVTLPPVLANPTLYSRNGDLFFFLAVLFLILPSKRRRP